MGFWRPVACVRLLLYLPHTLPLRPSLQVPLPEPKLCMWRLRTRRQAEAYWRGIEYGAASAWRAAEQEQGGGADSGGQQQQLEQQKRRSWVWSS